MKKLMFMLMCSLFFVATSFAGSPLRVPVRFTHTNDAGPSYEWFVVGSHPDVGAWNPAKAIKLVWSEGHVWWGDIGVQA